jgi:hypothetical protein
VTASTTSSILIDFIPFDWRIIAAVFIFILFGSVMTIAQISVSQTENSITVEDAPDMEVFAYGKTVTVKNRAKGVLAFGGDVIVEGKVYGDVASVGGSVIQKEGAYIGGDIFVVGGKYKPESANPLREEGRETVMYAGYEEELRNVSQNPSSLFAPNFSLAFVAQRIFSVLFWFVVSLGLATIAPGAVSRAIARFQLSTVKVVAIGAAAFLATTIVVIASLNILPNYLSAIFGLMMFVLLMLAYVFGRVALHVSVGKLLQKYIFGEGNKSEALSILIGVLAWTLLLSIPYLWTLALFILFSAGIGLVLTARPQGKWQVR